MLRQNLVQIEDCSGINNFELKYMYKLSHCYELEGVVQLSSKIHAHVCLYVIHSCIEQPVTPALILKLR